MSEPNHKEFVKLIAENFRLTRLKGKTPIEPGWQKFGKREFDQIGFLQGENAGILCSDMIVIDIDDPVLFEKTCKEKGWNLPETRRHRTGKGLQHLLYKAPKDGNRYGNRVLNKKFGFDIRGDGGVIVAPGSIHPETGEPYTVESDVPIAEAPEWLLKLALGNVSTSEGSPQPLSDASDVLKGVPEGERDAALLRYAAQLRAKGLSREEAEILICQAAQACTPPFPRQEALLKVASAWKYPVEFALTDLGNAERLVQRFGDGIRYCEEQNAWYVWNGRRWRRDKKGKVTAYAKETIRGRYAEAHQTKDENKRKQIVQHAVRSESVRAIRAMITLAQSEKEVAISFDQFDSDPWLLNVNNGVIDLRTGNLLPHDPAQLITKLAPVEYNPNTACPLWISFLDRIMAGNAALITFLKRAVGYCLSGNVREQCLFFLFGTGANGKSTFLELLRALLGDYAKQADFTTFLMKANDTVRNDIADLRGSRFVSAVEVEGGKRLAEALVKQVTGGDALKARFLYSEYFEFAPTFKIFLAANHKPEIHGTDYGIWRRIKLIPFTVTIPEKERDPELKEKLRAEMPGILKWAVEGCLEWQQFGLGEPKEVKVATEAYRVEMDLTAEFIKDCCVENATAKVKLSDLYGKYLEWCKESGEDQLEPKAFTRKLDTKGFSKKRGTGGNYYWYGIGLVTPTAQAA
jgi:putative DNA primase/helicase